MAATGKTPILLYGSTTATNVPVAGNLLNNSDGCEIAINVADKNLFFKDSTNTVNTVPIRQSSASSNGWLSSTDWTTFNSKQPAGSYAVTNAAQTFSGNQTFTGLLIGSTGPQTTSTLQGGLKIFTPGFSAQYGGIFGYTPSASIDQIEISIVTSGNTGVPAESVRFLKDGDVTINTGNLVIGTSGKGIDFSATAGTGTSELLADYEEGTWTPTDGSGAGLTFAATAGVYRKVGNLVTVFGYVQYPTTADTSTAKISGLPYTVLNSNAAVSGFITYCQSATIRSIGCDANSTTTTVYSTSGGVITNVTLSGTVLYFTLIYPV